MAAIQSKLENFRSQFSLRKLLLQRLFLHHFIGESSSEEVKEEEKQLQELTKECLQKLAKLALALDNDSLEFLPGRSLSMSINLNELQELITTLSNLEKLDQRQYYHIHEHQVFGLFCITTVAPSNSKTTTTNIVPYRKEELQQLTVVTLLDRQKLRLKSYDDFHDHEPIGEGRYGSVWRAKCKAIGDEAIALKSVPLMEMEAEPAIPGEVAKLTRLFHDNILTPLCIFVSEPDFEELFVVMPLMSTSLKAELESSRPMNEENIIELMNQLSCASQYLADNNVVHKDIRPSNIMVEKLSGRIQYKLSDFGSIMDFARGTPTFETSMPELIHETWAYMAPEVQEKMMDPMRNPLIDTRADAFSFGAVLVDVTLKDSDELEDKIVEIQNREQDPSLPANLDKMVPQLLEIDPEKRTRLHDLSSFKKYL